MIEIRAAEITDLPSVAQLVALSFHPGGGWQALWRGFLQLGIEQDLRDRWQRERPHYHCWLAIMPIGGASRCVGSVEVQLREIKGQPNPYLSNLAVHPDYRRRGIGRRLLQAVETHLYAIYSDYSDLYLHVLAQNQAARQLYARCGFEVVEEDFTFWGERKLLLRKSLTGDRPYSSSPISSWI
ncbi:MAG TPA: GNAT family N-acetyltransferase [Thermosynechococcus sp. M3746_W2019_013]|uniref:GNAT family N-acetyltransferase n=1 Tax=Thermosynechococcus sp. M3746_W2019_013 TaxID=2747806 RepID=UPI0019EC31AC|nr:GNAT family N-acetyltransferase [Thermosynechococcus sp. M3746_W2019_013]HIK23077.1 GNAT family N-acetyltransferase [Thermosynechococcus sp. M3746_W2019_013]